MTTHVRSYTRHDRHWILYYLCTQITDMLIGSLVFVQD